MTQRTLFHAWSLMMTKPFARSSRQVAALAAILVAAACSSPPAGLSDSDLSLQFIDGPADHVAGDQMPPFTVWVVDLFDRRFTGLEGGTVTLDLIDPSGAIQSGFATVSLDFGAGLVVPSTTLSQADGYTMRGRFRDISIDSPPFDVVPAPDLVQITNNSAGEVGVMVDGANNIVRFQDIPYRTSTGEREVGALNSGTLTQGVAVFAPDRRPELVPVTWTPDVDTLSIALQDPLMLPVTVWIVTGTFATEKTQVEQALAALTLAWRSERAGIAIGDVTVMDATSQEMDFGTFAVGMGGPFGAIGTGVGRAAGRYNIYVVTQVRDATGALSGGFAEQPGTAIAVASDSLGSQGHRLIGHELGHTFGLVDTNNVEGFLLEGNMMTSGQSSTLLTEGQVFRAHFNGFSSLRSFRTGDTFQPLSCDAFEATTHCPELSYRIWTEIEPAQVSRSP